MKQISTALTIMAWVVIYIIVVAGILGIDLL